MDFYSKLYTCRNDVSSECIDEYLNIHNLPQISETSKEICDQPICLEEVKKAVSEMKNNKSPGPDGIPAEFYKIFWNDISDIVFETYMEAYKSGKLILSQRQGVLCLIPKKGKDLTDLKSWRPLSILNADYKILAKLLSNRLKIALKEIINPDQIGYMENRFYGENTRLIADMIEFCKLKKHPSIILLVDFEKAFDTINWNFLNICLKHYGFGVNFQRWISILYCDTESCVSNNGHQSSYFKLSRGIRQGCPISALLFLLPAEIIAIILRSSAFVKGINIDNTCIKLCQLADDMTLFLRDNKSVRSAIQIFEEFYRYAGLKLNKNKTEAMIIYNDGSLHEDKKLGINWINKPFKTLGTWFSLDSNEMIALNIKEKHDIIKSILFSWQPRSLTLKGKITVVKSLVVPHILSLASVVPLSEKYMADLDKMLFNFIWSNRKHLVSKHTLIQPIENGGLKMVSVSDTVTSVKIMWIKRYCDPVKAKWKVSMEALSNFDKEKLLKKRFYKSFKSEPQTSFYCSLISTWYNFITIEPRSFKEFLLEPLFYNDLLQIGKSAITTEYNDLAAVGVNKIQDIVNEDGSFLSKQSIETKFGVSLDLLRYHKLGSCLKAKMNLLPKRSNVNRLNIPSLCIENIGKVNFKRIYNYLIDSQHKVPNSEYKWIEYYPFLDLVDWKRIYSLSKIVKDSFIVNLQYKILHRVINCNYNLAKWKIKESSQCDLCQNIDNIEHYFYYCEHSHTFWQQVEMWMASCLSVKIKFTVLETLLGFLSYDCEFFFIVNYIVLLGKYYIYVCKKEAKLSSLLSLYSFLCLMKDKMCIEYQIYMNQNQCDLYKERFGKLKLYCE